MPKEPPNVKPASYGDLAKALAHWSVSDMVRADPELLKRLRVGKKGRAMTFFHDLYDDAESLIRRGVLLVVWTMFGYVMGATASALTFPSVAAMTMVDVTNPAYWPIAVQWFWMGWIGAAIGYIIKNEI